MCRPFSICQSKAAPWPPGRVASAAGGGIEQQHLRHIVIGGDARARSPGSATGNALITGMPKRARISAARARRLLAMQLEEIRLHLRRRCAASVSSSASTTSAASLSRPRIRSASTAPASRRQIAGAFGEEHQAAKIGAGAQRRIGGGGRIDPADFDLDRHGMGLMGSRQARNQANPEPRPKLMKSLGFRR